MGTRRSWPSRPGIQGWTRSPEADFLPAGPPSSAAVPDAARLSFPWNSWCGGDGIRRERRVPGLRGNAEELSQNVRSLGFDLDQLIEDGKLVVDYVHIDRSEIDETGEYDLEGLFIRLADAIDQVGAKRVVLDDREPVLRTLERRHPPLRAAPAASLAQERGVTAIITGERGEKSLTRQGLEEYVSDCVILLDHRVSTQLSTRRLRIVKYRGSTHGTNEYPFLIDQLGISVLPITSLGLKHAATNERVSTGIPALDAMLGGGGVYRAASILISGTAGTGKSTISAHFADAACRRGDRCLYFAFEESPDQIIRNMRSVSQQKLGSG